MARPCSIRSEALLEVARRIFMRDGYQASTLLIAREAGVSEGSLFKHFKSKCNLFRKAMEVEAGEPAWEATLLAAAGQGNIARTLEEAGGVLLQQLRLMLPRLMMINSSGVTLPKYDQPGVRPPPLQKLDVLKRYLEAEVRAGRLDMPSPGIQAHAFLGALSHYAWCETLLNYKPAPPREYVHNLVHALLKAAAVSPAPARGAASPSPRKRQRP